jgi:hypothetical protein
MAQKVTVALEDDLDGGPADQTVRFAIGGAQYEIDLSASNATAFPRRPGRSAGSRERSGAIRAWANQAGIAVSERGRIPASVADQYEAAARRS